MDLQIRNSGGEYQILINGNSWSFIGGVSGTLNAGDNFVIRSEGTNAKFYKNGTLVYTRSLITGNNLSMYFGLIGIGDTLTNIRFGSFGYNSSKSYTFNYDGDDTFLVTNEVTNMVSVYFAKQNDVKSWVLNNL